MRTIASGAASMLSVVLAALVTAGEIATAPPAVRLAAASPVGPGPVGPPAEPLRVPAGATTASALIDACVTAAMLRHDTPGAAVAVITDGAMTYQQGYGVKRRGGSEPVGPDTIFRIGSVTKQLTAAAVMQQVEIGAVDLDDPVTVYVPELALAGSWEADVIRVHHLLTHTSGYPDNLTSVSGATDAGALSRWVATQSSVSLHAPPGTFWNYSNPNFMLAGLVLERASGEPYRDYLAGRVFEPAGMTRTTFDPATVIADGDYSWGHYTDPTTGSEVVYAPDSYDSGAAGPAGWAFSTAGDLARWALLLADGGGDVLTSQSAVAMQSPQVFVDSAPASWYGYGIFVDLYEGLEVREHGGNVPGWGTYLLWDPAGRDVVAVVANTFESLPEAAYCIFDRTFFPPGGSPAVIDPEPVPTATVPDAYAGFDSLGNPWGGLVTLDGGRLMLDMAQVNRPGNHFSAPLVRAFRDTYVVDVDGDGGYDLDFTFVTSPGTPGRTSWLVNRQLVLERSFAVRRGSRP